MGGISSAISSVTSSFSSFLSPKVEKPKPPKQAVTTAPGLDPNRGAGISAAKKSKIAALGAKGRSSLRIDLQGNGDDLQAGRSGLRIA